MSGEVDASTLANAARPKLNPLRLLLASVLTPLLPAFYAAILLADPWLLPIGICAAYPSEVLIALPLALALRKRGRAQLGPMIAVGALSALPAVLLYAFNDPIPHLAPFDPLHGAYVLGWGAFAGACFWLIAFAGESPLRWRNLFDVGPTE